MCMITFSIFTPPSPNLHMLTTWTCSNPRRLFLYGQARATDKGAAEARAERAEAESRDLAQRLMEIKQREARPLLAAKAALLESAPAMVYETLLHLGHAAVAELQCTSW